MTKPKPKSPQGSKRYHYKAYRRSQFTEESDYYRFVDGKKVPLTQEELEWLRKFQWDEISCDNRNQLDPEERKEQDHSQYAKRNDVMNVGLSKTSEYAFTERSQKKITERADPGSSSWVDFISNLPDLSPALERSAEKDALLQALEERNRAKFLTLILKFEVPNPEKVMAMFDLKTKPKRPYQRSRKYRKSKAAS
jgi:hypothetical protein